jgi:hypothetical protein
MPDLDDDIMRELMFRSTTDLFAPPSAAAAALRRQHRRQVRTRVLSVTGIAAAAGLVVGTIATAGPGPHTAPSSAGGATTHTAQLTAAQQTLYDLSAAAAAARRPGGRYVVLTEKSVDTGSGSSDSETGLKTSVIDTLTGGGVTYQDITVSGSNGDPQPPAVLQAAPGTSPTLKQLDAMPTDPAALRAFLLVQAKQQLNEAYADMERDAKRAGKQIPAKLPTGPQPTDNDLVFEQAADLLWEPHLSPSLRAALYKVLAATPGVTVTRGTTDSVGRPAVEISRVDTVGKAKVETFENPKTGATLESAWLEPSGELLEDLYLSISYTNHIPPNPYRG